MAYCIVIVLRFLFSDTFGYFCDIGSMTVDVHHESFADNMIVNMTVKYESNSSMFYVF
jgi:hypothetical protein